MEQPAVALGRMLLTELLDLPALAGFFKA